ncbi:MAG: phospholipase D-like domain-containing protein, partial [Desulfovibrionaceae bacterium]
MTLELKITLRFLLTLLPLLPVYPLHAETLTLNGVRTEVYFSPKGGAEEAIVRTIGHAKHEICVLAYSFTSAPINAALEAANRRKVKVRVVLDKSQLTARGGKLHNL